MERSSVAEVVQGLIMEYIFLREVKKKTPGQNVNADKGLKVAMQDIVLNVYPKRNIITASQQNDKPLVILLNAPGLTDMILSGPMHIDCIEKNERTHNVRDVPIPSMLKCVIVFLFLLFH